MMDCREARAAIEAYVDGESPAATAEAMGAHVDSCPDCAGRAAFQRLLKRCVREAGQGGPLPALARQRVLQRLRQEQAEPLRASGARRPLVRYAVMAAAAMLLVLLPLWQNLLTGRPPLPAAEATALVQDHRHCWTVPCGGPEDRRVQQWLRDNPGVEALLPAPPGATRYDVRVCRTADGAAALHVMWKLARPGEGSPATASLYVRRRDSAAHGPFECEETAGLVWEEGGYQWALVGDLPPGELLRMSQAPPSSSPL